MAFLWTQHVVIASERDNTHLLIFVAHLAEFICLKSPTGDDKASFYFGFCVRGLQLWLCAKQNLASLAGKSSHLAASDYFAAGVLDNLRVSMGYFYEVDDPCIWRIDGSYARCKRFLLSQPLRSDHFQPLNPICDASPVKVL